MDIDTANTLVGVGTALLNLATVVLLVMYLVPSMLPSWLASLISRAGLWGMFVVTAFASFLTLYYSEVLGATPCGLCWLQRVFLYPQVVIFGIAAWKKDISAWIYVVALSILGAIVALYQHYLQMGGYDAFPCPATGSAADCTARTMFELGYITYPFMAFSLFVFIIIFLLIARRLNSGTV
jgi:disulfide bond formation protein DsbB